MRTIAVTGTVLAEKFRSVSCVHFDCENVPAEVRTAELVDSVGCGN